MKKGQGRWERKYRTTSATDTACSNSPWEQDEPFIACTRSTVHRTHKKFIVKTLQFKDLVWFTRLPIQMFASRFVFLFEMRPEINCLFNKWVKYWIFELEILASRARANNLSLVWLIQLEYTNLHLRRFIYFVNFND